jgi:pimeloyl-ACP methyl ester carboxylesterase
MAQEHVTSAESELQLASRDIAGIPLDALSTVETSAVSNATPAGQQRSLPLVVLSPFWELVLPALTAAYRVIRYDARGCGRSPAPTVKYSLYDDLVAVLGHYGLDRVAVTGCSQGGATGLALAVEQPGRVSALVLLCTGVPGYP